MRAELSRKWTSAQEVAERLSIHRRTLSRHLNALGTGYRTVADQVRFEVARQLVAETDIPLAQISAALDFSEPAAFTHAFEKWSGVAPSVWRARHRPSARTDKTPPPSQCGRPKASTTAS